MNELVIGGLAIGGVLLLSRKGSSSSSSSSASGGPVVIGPDVINAPSGGVPRPNDKSSGGVTDVTSGRPADPSCGCGDEELGKPPRANARSYTVQSLPELREKARIFPDTGFIQVAGPWWAGLSDTQRMAVLAHELAHDEDMSSCEECADARAGAILRYEGLEMRVARAALASVVSTRTTTAQNVERGWRAADRAIRAQGNTASGLKGAAATSGTTSWPVPAGRPPAYTLDLYARHLENDADQTSEGSPASGAGDDIELGTVDPDLATSIGTPSGNNPQPVTGGQLVPKGSAGATTPSSSKPKPTPAAAPFSVTGKEAAAFAIGLGAIVLLVALARKAA